MSKRDLLYGFLLLVILFVFGLFIGFHMYKPISESEIAESIRDNEDYNYESYYKGFQNAYEEIYPDKFVDGWTQYENDSKN